MLLASVSAKRGKLMRERQNVRAKQGRKRLRKCRNNLGILGTKIREDGMREVNAKVIAIEAVAKDFVHIVLAAPEIAQCAKPGQFIQVNCGQAVYSLLPRPISIHRVKDGCLILLVQVKGEGTRWLARRHPGDTVSFFGPLGNGFPLPEKGPVILAAGGIGVAPLVFLAEVLKNKGIPFTFLFGARNREGLALLKELETLNIDVQIATEDGSVGQKGFVTELLCGAKPESVYACGPEPMLRALANWGKEEAVPTMLSLEARMACGVGACRGCVTKVKRGEAVVYENVCNCGPVFDGNEVVFDD